MRELEDILINLIVVAILLFVVSCCMGAEVLPVPVRIPTPMFSTDDCDCDACCCTICNCVSLSYDAALQKALDENKPIAVFMNTKVHPIEGCVVCHVTHLPGFEHRVGVLVGAPWSWENKGEGFRVIAEIYGPASPKKILEFVNAHKAYCEKQKPAFFRPANLLDIN